METRTQAPTQEQSAIVERVARIVSRVRGTKPDYARLAAELEPAIPFDVFGIVLLRHDREAVRVAVCTRDADVWVARYHQHPLKDSMVERILQRSEAAHNQESADITATGSHITLDSPDAGDMAAIDIRNYPDGLDGPPAQCGDALSGKPYLHATLIAPLVVEDRVLGSLELGSTRLDAYADQTLQRLISAVGRVLAAAIESAQVGGSVEIQDRQREELKNVSSALALEMDLSMILNRIVVGIAKALNVASAIITLDRRRGSLKLEAQYGLDAVVLEKIVGRESALNEKTIIGFTLRRRQPCVSNDIALDNRFPTSQLFASQLGMRSIFSYPLVTGSTVYGALLLCSSEPGGFTPLKLDILSLFASQATIAIHNGMLLEAARERRRFQEAIERLDKAHQQISSASTDGQDDLVLLGTVREESERTFGVSFSSLLHFISDHLLTSSERDLQDILHDIQDEQKVKDINYDAGTVMPSFQEERTATLVQTAETALARAGFLGDVSAALTRAIAPNRALSSATPVMTQLYERVTRDMTIPWFVTDPQGRCIYVNPAAEVFCGIRFDLDSLGNIASLHRPANGIEHSSRKVEGHDMPWPLESQAHFTTYMSFFQTMVSQSSSFTLLEALAGLLPRIRNVDEVLTYLQEFTYSDLDSNSGESVEHEQDVASIETMPANTLRCVIAAEPVLRRSPQQFQDDAKDIREREPGSFKIPSAKLLRNRFSNPQTLFLDSAPSDRHYQLMRYALYDPQGQLLANALQIQDITEQVRDEKNKSVLLSTVSHDLRTPLTTIKAAVTGLLQADVVWDEQMRREILEDIDAEADHLYTLVNSLIEMSRIDMGALVLEKEWCDLAEIVHSTLVRDERFLAEHPVRTIFQPQLPMIQVDYVQIQRVLLNLLENAARYSPENAEIVIAIDSVTGGVEEVGSFQDSLHYLRLRVIDHGSGVPEEERERIFKPFYSLDSQGSGLGLAICRGIVEAHQGQIWVEPAPGGGSCFVFVLPISS
jgi:signal transduction histidine kinase/GAF domain-containing protein